MAKVTYNPSYPASIQNDDWSCAPTSLDWAMRSLGRAPGNQWIETDMVNLGYVTHELGLMDHRGAGIVEWLSLPDPAHYGPDGHGISTWQNPISWDQLVAELIPVPRSPILLGLPSWAGPNKGHWSGVRGYDAARKVILLANPDTGANYGQTALDRQGFESRAGDNASIVRVLHPDLLGVDETGSGGKPPEGIDVASHQGAVDWRAVAAAGMRFGFTKASGGAWYQNPTCAANWAGMKGNNLKRGAYHYAFELTGQPFPGPGPEAEAEWFLATIMPLGIEAGDMLVLDIEEGQGPLGHWALRWCQRVEARVGFKPQVYTSRGFAQGHGFAAVPELAAYGLWLADWDAASMPPPCAPWTHTAFWQFTDHGSVPGVSGNCDVNRFNGVVEELAKYGKPGSIVTPPPGQTDTFSVTDGIRAKMAEAGDRPASDELYFKKGETDEWSECMGASGSRYVYIVSLNRTFRYPPAA